MFSDFFSRKPQVTVVASDILRCNFLTQEGCIAIQETCKALNSWSPELRDEYATYDIHLEDSLPEFFNMIEEHFTSYILPSCIEYWQIPTFTLKTVFALKYSPDTQTSLKLHHDDSYISGSIKLNTNYKGAELYFPSKNYDNSNVDAGQLLIWPSDITHRHGSKELLEGEKYSLTLWTTKDEEVRNI